MQVIINLEKIVDVECLKHAHELTEEYWSHPDNSWLYGSDSHSNSIIIEDGIPTGFLQGSSFRDWDDTEAIKENSASSNPFTNGSDCCKHWNRVKHNFIPVVEEGISETDCIGTYYQIGSILYKNDEIEILREEQSTEKNEPYIYFIDVFKHNIEDNDDAFCDALSESFLDIHNILDYLENNFGISKKIIKEIENGRSYQKFLEDHKERLDHIANTNRRKNENN